MIPLLLLLQQTNIDQKLKNAPDSNYQIGVLIGTFIPFAVLVAIAYWMYYRAKKREKNL